MHKKEKCHIFSVHLKASNLLAYTHIQNYTHTHKHTNESLEEIIIIQKKKKETAAAGWGQYDPWGKRKW